MPKNPQTTLVQPVEQAPSVVEPTAPTIDASASESPTQDPSPTAPADPVPALIQDPTKPTNVFASRTLEEMEAGRKLVAQFPVRADVPLPKLSDEAHHNEVQHRIKHEFLDKVMQARANQQEKPYTPPERPVQVVRQTNLEMEAGAKRVSEFQAEQDARPAPKKERWDGSEGAVFRPADYVPDPKKNQGHVNARPVPTSVR